MNEDYQPIRMRPVDMRAVYVSFLEVASSQRSGRGSRRFVGLGAAMLSFSVARARQPGFGGRVGLHSIEQARRFYAKIGFRKVAEPGPNEYWETYLELAPDAADQFLHKGTVE